MYVVECNEGSGWFPDTMYTPFESLLEALRVGRWISATACYSVRLVNDETKQVVYLWKF